LSLVLHHLDHSRSTRVLWLLEELGVPYELVQHQRKANLRAPDSLKAVHPLGKAPVLIDDGVPYAESAAILEHLAETHGGERFLPPRGTPAHESYRYWLHFAEASLMFPLLLALVAGGLGGKSVPFPMRPFGRLFGSGLRKTLVDPDLERLLGHTEATLGARPWFAGESLSLADMQMVFPLEAAVDRVPLERAKYPNIHAWLDRIHERPAWQAAIAKGGPVAGRR
jgi:glutathione S-transferase